MNGKEPASCTVDFETTGATSGNHDIHVVDNINKLLNDQEFSFGNRIGHCPESPKQFLSPENHTRPHSILNVIKSFSASYFEAKIYKNLYYHLDKDGKSSRLIRSEFREMISLGASIITHYYDVLSGEIGFRNERGKDIRISYQKMASTLGVSLIRVKRFFHFLKQRNFITIIQDKKKDQNGNWKSNISRKIVKPSFFINTLGISAWKNITKYKEWLIKKAKPSTKKAKDNVDMVKHLITSIGQSIVKSVPFRRSGNPDKEKDFISKAMDRYEKDPSKSLSEHLKQLKIQS